MSAAPEANAYRRKRQREKKRRKRSKREIEASIAEGRLRSVAEKKGKVVRSDGTDHHFQTKNLSPIDGMEPIDTEQTIRMIDPDWEFVPCVPYRVTDWEEYRELLKKNTPNLYPDFPPSKGLRMNDYSSWQDRLLTLEVFAAVVNAIKKGAYRQVAAQAVGVSKRMLKEWKARGRKIDEQIAEGVPLEEVSPRQHLLFWHFLQSMEQAEGVARRTAEQVVYLQDPRFWLRFGPGKDRGEDDPGWSDAILFRGKGKNGEVNVTLTVEDLVQQALLPPPSEKN